MNWKGPLWVVEWWYRDGWSVEMRRLGGGNFWLNYKSVELFLVELRSFLDFFGGVCISRDEFLVWLGSYEGVNSNCGVRLFVGWLYVEL